MKLSPENTAYIVVRISIENPTIKELCCIGYDPYQGDIYITPSRNQANLARNDLCTIASDSYVFKVVEVNVDNLCEEN